jgi:putative hemolysin
METFFQVVILFILVVLSAFFSAAETALMSIHFVRVKSLFKKGKAGSKTLYNLKKDPHKLIVTILIGNNIVNISASAIATGLFLNIFGSEGVAIAAGVMTLIILTFGEILPKTFAIQNAEKISLLVAVPIHYLSILFYPLIIFYSSITKLVSRWVRPKVEKKISEEELKIILTLSREAAKIMHKVLDFEDMPVIKVMTPKEQMKTIDGDLKIDEAIDVISRYGHSRYPVYFEDEDNIIGIVDVDDVLRAIKEKKSKELIKDIIRPIEFVSPEKEIGDIFYDFEDKSVLMAIVVDKSGEVIGLLTIEDILEEIVGNIFDKSNRKKRRN